MADKYCRLVSFMVNICPEPLRELFIAQAKADQGIAYTTLGSYLVFKRPQIEQLINRNKLNDDQFDLLFPSPGSDPADVSQWDISLLTFLITELFGKILQKSNIPIISFINEIRDIRNYLLHLSNTRCMSDSTFDDTWQQLETATLFLASLPGASYESKIKQKIEDGKVNNMPDLGNTLCLWFEEKITQMQKKIEEISTCTKDIQTHTLEGTAILRSATVSKQGPSGETVKRLKTVDKKLKTMQDNIEWRMRSDIPDNYGAPPEVDRIKTQLRDNRFVVVAGHNISHYIAAALSAIKDSYNGKRCAELQSSSDWSHVDLEVVDFVLYCHPFGNGVYDEEKSKDMADIFNKIQHAVKEEIDGNKLAVMIVTDVDVLDKLKKRHDHEILKEVVTVYHSTSEAQPTDLTVAKCISNFPSTSAVANNLTDLTGLFLKHHKREVDPDILKAAKAKIKSHKAVVLTGPRGIGKTSLTVALADSYHPFQVLLLTYPKQVQHVDLSKINLVVIEDFVGKYEYNKANICNWFKTFDLLHVMKSAGKLNIIITCDKENLEKCRDKIGDHPLLEHSVELLSQCVLVKQEMSNTDISTQTQQITRQPQQSHVVPTTVSVSSHGEHRSNSSSIRLAQPPNVHIPVVQSQISHTHGTQSLPPAHSQAHSSLYRTPHLPTIPFTSFTMSAEPESPFNLSVPKYTSVISMKRCVIKGVIGSGIYIKCASMCLTKDKSMYVAVNKIGFDWTYDYLLYIEKDTNKTIKYSLKDRIEQMCCTDTGDIVIINLSNVLLLRINDGSPVVIKTKAHNYNSKCVAIICDDEDQIYAVWSNGTVKIYNTSLVIIGEYLVSKGYGIEGCIVSPKGHIFHGSISGLYYVNFKRKLGVSDYSHDFSPVSALCAASEDPFTVFVLDGAFKSILQFDSRCQKISEIPVTFSESQNISCMVFDETTSRLILYESNSMTIHEIFLK